MRLDCYMVKPSPPPLVPGVPDRDWMDAFNQRFPYRCLPLAMANTSGWEIRCTADFQVEWDGSPSIDALKVSEEAQGLALSHFGGGVLTFHPGYLFRTPPGWAIWATGAPNHVKDAIQPLTGLIETDWLPFPFTMNWRMTRPGRARFKKGEPFCFITLIQHYELDAVEPVIRKLEDAPDLKAEYDAWRGARDTFLKLHAEKNPETLRQGWQKHYFNARPPQGGGTAPEIHVRKRRLEEPRFE
ncbi:DUF6065 family protein [Rhodobacter sp. SY28-1]|uniref:DUF6065 family protein n=1 Tax=Rhodobacter sp. SY28-1 TaxID=2562317 RepID=UPI0010C01BD0|nr:DUF6065 family protein [Rhodobacter sp. SY28-1]